MERMKIFTIVTLVVLLSATSVFGGPKTRLLQELVAEDQRLERLHGLPVIISEKTYSVLLSPDAIMLGTETVLAFNLVVSNPTRSQLIFSIDKMSAFSANGRLKILNPDEVVAHHRKFYSRDEYNISKEQEEMLAPFVEEKMERLRQKVMRSRTLEPGEKVAGILTIEVPFGTPEFTIEVVTGIERHRFEFNVGEF